MSLVRPHNDIILMKMNLARQRDYLARRAAIRVWRLPTEETCGGRGAGRRYLPGGRKSR